MECGERQTAEHAVPGGFWERQWLSFLFKWGLWSKRMLPSMAFKDRVQKWWWGFSLGTGWSMKVKHWLVQRWTLQGKQDSSVGKCFCPWQIQGQSEVIIQLEGFRIQFFYYLFSQMLLFLKKNQTFLDYMGRRDLDKVLCGVYKNSTVRCALGKEGQDSVGIQDVALVSKVLGLRRSCILYWFCDLYYAIGILWPEDWVLTLCWALWKCLHLC